MPGFSENQIRHMVVRFLNWRLPENFRPDAGISFKADFNEHTAYPMKHKPAGTNLFDAVQAEAMVRHMIKGMPPGEDYNQGARDALDCVWSGLSGDKKVSP